MNDELRPFGVRPGANTNMPQNNQTGVPPTAGRVPVHQEPTTHSQPPGLRQTPFHKPPRRGLAGLIHHLRHLSRKQIIIISMVIGLLLASVLIWWFVIRKKPAAPQPTPQPEAKVEPQTPPSTVPSRLTGVSVTPDLNNLPTTGVMIENSPDARPQSGIYHAGVVFEAIAEGGITRFLVLYLESKPDYIGPVRSVRPYYLDFLVPFDAPIAHAGGSGDALAQIKAQGIRDMDHGANAAYFQRVSGRFAPHNLYTSRPRLLELQGAKGFNTSTFTGFERKGDSPSQAPNARTFDLSISGFLYNPHFDYVPSTNSYLRSQGGKPHTDEKTGTQINPKVVVALVMPRHNQGIYSAYGATGSGAAYVFQDGAVTEGKWHKNDRKSQFKFTKPNGEPLALNAGQTWISIITSPGAISHKP